MTSIPAGYFQPGATQISRLIPGLTRDALAYLDWAVMDMVETSDFITTLQQVLETDIEPDVLVVPENNSWYGETFAFCVKARGWVNQANQPLGWNCILVSPSPQGTKWLSEFHTWAPFEHRMPLTIFPLEMDKDRSFTAVFSMFDEERYRERLYRSDALDVDSEGRDQEEIDSMRDAIEFELIREAITGWIWCVEQNLSEIFKKLEVEVEGSLDAIRGDAGARQGWEHRNARDRSNAPFGIELRPEHSWLWSVWCGFEQGNVGYNVDLSVGLNHPPREVFLQSIGAMIEAGARLGGIDLTNVHRTCMRNIV